MRVYGHAGGLSVKERYFLAEKREIYLRKKREEGEVRERTLTFRPWRTFYCALPGAPAYKKSSEKEPQYSTWVTTRGAEWLNYRNKSAI